MKAHGKLMQRKARQWANKNGRSVDEFWDSSEYAQLIANEDKLWDQTGTTEYPQRIGLVHTD